MRFCAKSKLAVFPLKYRQVPLIYKSPAFSSQIPIWSRSSHISPAQPWGLIDKPKAQGRSYSSRRGTAPLNNVVSEAEFWGMFTGGKREMAPQQQSEPGHGGKRPLPKQGSRLSAKRSQKKARKRERDMKNGSHEEVLGLDVQELHASLNRSEDTTTDGDDSNAANAVEEVLPEQGSEIEVEVVELSSTGDGLALQKGSKRIYVVPFAVPGDIVKVKAYRHLPQYTVTDFISVLRPSPSRDDSRIQCKYFATCSGCQYQMLDYDEQLRLKKRIVEKAFKNFSQLPPELIPAIQDTIGSPLQYGYRTKLTPHFDGHQGWRKTKTPFEKRPDIGFMPKGKRKTMDIEDCPIGTDAVRMGMKLERERMEVEFGKYKNGATILLRESTKRIPKNADSTTELETPPNTIRVETDTYTDLKTCVTDNKGTSTEYIGDFVFHNPAGSFFQNNNSILPVFTDYVRQHILPPPSASSSPSSSPPIQYLIDAYSGSGLFTITLSSLFRGSTGIDIAESSIAFARTNARANALPESQARFIAADAGELFGSVAYDPDRTVVVLDPPRKGCDAAFLRQLLRFAPRRVLYVSCNVHTQARDVGALVRGETASLEDQDQEGEGEEESWSVPVETKSKTKTRYEIESLRGFDFFPQTGHVEGVAVLNRVDDHNDDNTGTTTTKEEAQ
ncbi:S-adenosyl-L-methionine-dependent methyltransferase [Biscogniauxia mediterranea]|nr:S-adenosyl-L-methionine-dependent methyltransferase [Biscogniauxia mediterranea]